MTAGRVSSSYTGPDRISEFTLAGRRFELVHPADPDRLLNDPDVLAWNAADDYMPYWAYLWPGAYLLAQAVAEESWTPGVTALELGCGLGLAGTAALSAGVSCVHFSDYDEAPLRFVERTMKRNGFDACRYSLDRIDWHDPPHQTYALILGADVLYERRLVPLVVGVLDRMLSSDGVAMVAGPYRVATEDLEPALRAAGFQCTSSPVTAQREDGRPVRGTLHRIKRDWSAALR
jgi:predicted nicotinamide N-methyase